MPPFFFCSGVIAALGCRAEVYTYDEKTSGWHSSEGGLILFNGGQGGEKEYDDGRVQALRGMSFRIRKGEFVAIAGPSGCGKTTLLQMLGALDVCSAGILHYRSRSLADLADPSGYLAREIGIIFQAFHLFPTFTALETYRCRC